VTEPDIQGARWSARAHCRIVERLTAKGDTRSIQTLNHVVNHRKPSPAQSQLVQLDSTQVTLKQHTGTTQDNNNCDQRCRNVSCDIENPQHKISTAIGDVRESNFKVLETATYVTTQKACCKLDNRLLASYPINSCYMWRSNNFSDSVSPVTVAD
jgi:hypothetical protein